MGLLGSGKQGVDLTKFGQNYATNTYQTQLQNLMSLSGVGVNQNGSPTANAGAASSALGSQLGGLLGGGLSSIISDVGLA
jgi:predicted lipid-binding transport protein (Tim44 family)